MVDLPKLHGGFELKPCPESIEIYCIACKVKCWSHISIKIPLLSHDCYLGSKWIEGYIDSLMGKTKVQTGLWADFEYLKEA